MDVDVIPKNFQLCSNILCTAEGEGERGGEGKRKEGGEGGGVYINSGIQTFCFV